MARLHIPLQHRPHWQKYPHCRRGRRYKNYIAVRGPGVEQGRAVTGGKVGRESTKDEFLYFCVARKLTRPPQFRTWEMANCDAGVRYRIRISPREESCRRRWSRRGGISRPRRSEMFGAVILGRLCMFCFFRVPASAHCAIRVMLILFF